MKRTTYIILGMLLTGLIVMSAALVYLFTWSADSDRALLKIAGAYKTVNLPQCKVLELTMNESSLNPSVEATTKIRWASFQDTPLTVSPSKGNLASFAYSSDMDRYMKIQSSGDTLKIVFDFSEGKLDSEKRSMDWFTVHSREMKIALPDQVQLLNANLLDQNVKIEGFKRDSLSVGVRGNAVMESSHFKALNVQRGDWQFNSGEVENLHLYLDDIRTWNVNTTSFHIDKEYLSGRNNSESVLQKGECHQIIWNPQSPDASLRVELKQAAEIKVIK